ncbi:uncharacterized protein LOC143875437 isoform X4 [Tasmannia lanceolata]|uniref:uncharacterized protein LOC143875437 isoform X4 n=1 Tax=Tasmannia lanceolata TaxID=3420 RepID=UPI004062B34D
MYLFTRGNDVCLYRCFSTPNHVTVVMDALEGKEKSIQMHCGIWAPFKFIKYTYSGFFYDRTKTSQLAVVFSSFSSAGSTLNNTEQSLSQLASRLSRSDPSGQQDGIICSLHSFGSRVRCTSRKQLGSLSCATHYGRCSGAWTWCLYLSTVCIIEGFRSPTHLTPLVFLVLGFFLGHILPSDL